MLNRAIFSCSANMNKKIVIIGAGASGIACGTKLMSNGFRNIVILEGENRIGGRIHTIPFGKNVLDLGAQWCHGQSDNVVHELGSKFNVFASNTAKYDGSKFYQSDGTQLSPEWGDKLMALVISIIEEYKDEMRRYQGSLGNFIVEKYQEALRTEQFKDVDANVCQQFLDFFHKYENSIEASDTWFDTSCKGYCEYWDCDGDRLLNWKDKGYRTVFDLLMKKIPNPEDVIPIEEKILFNKTVTNIDWKHTKEPAVTIQCSDGTIIDADHVIVTVSLGVLKAKHLQLFNPPLPPKKVSAIEGLVLGTVDKIYLEFEKPFWDKDWEGFSLLWKESDLAKIRQMEHNWLEHVFGFYVVDFQPNILCGWISGPNARRMELASDDDVCNGVTMLLRMFLKNFNIPDPVAIRRTQWYSNPHFRGSYTFRSLKSDMLNVGPSDLAEPITNSQGQAIVQFAGEATHDHYYSTVHGAIESGWREAKRIVDLYKANTNDMKIKNPNGRSAKDGTNNSVDVIIIGAGLAGLGSATKLQSAGLRFLILEAQPKAGGRVNTMNLKHSTATTDSNENRTSSQKSEDQMRLSPRDFVDTGAQWLHGKFNYLHDVAERYDLLSTEQSEEGLGAFLRDDDDEDPIDDYFVKKVDFLIGQILSECEKYAQMELTDYPKSVHSFLVDNFSKYLDSLEDPKLKVLAQSLFDWHIRFQVIDNSCLSLEHVSAKSWGAYSYNGESCQAHYNFRSGFSSAIDTICNQIDRKNILFKKDVVQVAAANTSCPRISVKCSDNTIYHANHVIVTLSLGCLKAHLNSLFKPALPRPYTQTIRDIGFETINKIFIQFEFPWWNDVDGIQLVFKSDHYEDHNWTRHISGFDVMKPGPANTLLAWVGGHGALAMEKLSDSQVIDDCIALLAQFTKSEIPAPIKYYCTRWHSNAYVRGAYSYISTDCDKNGTSSRLLSMPITMTDLGLAGKESTQFDKNRIMPADLDLMANNQRQEGNNDNCMPVILFAGEACHQQYFSTAHGAFLSGIEQAEKILNYYKKCDQDWPF